MATITEHETQQIDRANATEGAAERLGRVADRLPGAARARS